jgi:hypothetical protein
VTAELERRYRWLLGWYPREHREFYQEEMLGVLVNAASDGQRWPAAAEALSLIRDSASARLRRVGRRPVDERWRRAAAVTAVLATGILLAFHTGALLGVLPIRFGSAVVYVDRPPVAGPSYWTPVVAWALVLVAGLLAAPRVGVALAWLAALVEMGIQGLVYVRFTEFGPPDLWTAGLGVTVAACITAVAGGEPVLRAGVRLLGRRRLVPFAVVVVLLACEPLADRYLAVGYALYASLTCAVLAAGVVLVGAGGPVRRRILALLVPAILLTVLHNGATIAIAKDLLPVPNFLAPLQWLVLLALPPALLLLAAALIRRWERRFENNT